MWMKRMVCINMEAVYTKEWFFHTSNSTQMAYQDYFKILSLFTSALTDQWILLTAIPFEIDHQSFQPNMTTGEKKLRQMEEEMNR